MNMMDRINNRKNEHGHDVGTGHNHKHCEHMHDEHC